MVMADFDVFVPCLGLPHTTIISLSKKEKKKKKQIAQTKDRNCSEVVSI